MTNCLQIAFVGIPDEPFNPLRSQLLSAGLFDQLVEVDAGVVLHDLLAGLDFDLVPFDGAHLSDVLVAAVLQAGRLFEWGKLHSMIQIILVTSPSYCALNYKSPLVVDAPPLELHPP